MAMLGYAMTPLIQTTHALSRRRERAGEGVVLFQGMRLGTITWRTRQGSNADQQCFLTVDHEHVLVYGAEGFSFNGFEKSYEMYGNSDKDQSGMAYCVG